MRLRRENIDLPEDQGCLRWVLGVPLGFVYVPALFFCWLALAAQADPPDDIWREGVRTTAHVSIILCAIGLLITLTPVFRRTMGKWWYILPLLLAAVAYVRAETV
ncbi:hypothetical protein OG765_20455 [Streptomyces sp. NBC_00555]|uniref:hypothetical protein n=1 Tax=Streptomyces sp. NBC_00555 TaxID=2903662 RepID=UPI00225AE37A|nr:hypothetical protein [Streptomyces sp. NBC_00555]MCX5013343.1 hypothetical protein [Streptomyces sp. NBC_00555]